MKCINLTLEKNIECTFPSNINRGKYNDNKRYVESNTSLYYTCEMKANVRGKSSTRQVKGYDHLFLQQFPRWKETRLRQIVLLGNMLIHLFHDPLFRGNRFRPWTETGIRGFKSIFWNTHRFQILRKRKERVGKKLIEIYVFALK